MDTGASNNGTANKKNIMNLRKDRSSSGMMGISGKAIKNRYSCHIPDIFCSNTSQEEIKATIIDATYNPKYKFNAFSIRK